MSFVTIERHFHDHLSKINPQHQDIVNILYDINVVAKMIRQKVVRSGLNEHLMGSTGTVNSSGEETQALDMHANSIIKEVLSSHGRFCYMGSEEETNVVQTETHKSSDYVILFDPLDGSSNIDVNVSVGTIFSIFRKNNHATSLIDHCCQEGIEQIAAGYVIYGSSVVMVYTAGHGVHGFTYDPTIGEFLLSHKNIRIPSTPLYYSVNESLLHHCDQKNQDFIASIKQTLSLRYVGSFVADFHRNLLKGGIYIYPSTTTHPNGKLRLLYEANPLAFICEQAGGMATSGNQRILNIKPTELHERTPLYIGSKSLVESYLSFEPTHIHS